MAGEDKAEAGAMMAATVDSEAREEVNGAMTEAMEVMAAGIWAREAGALEVEEAGARAEASSGEVRGAAPGQLEAEAEVVEAVAVR